ncbi:AAA family ATPase [Pararhizobium sp. PWRC1-1]|uniref:AAA family ATPase n=1 Tax=Pararhizobium sp. PWRC1-1 TaxID=2804566 RepID=UPI003CEFD308
MPRTETARKKEDHVLDTGPARAALQALAAEARSQQLLGYAERLEKTSGGSRMPQAGARARSVIPASVEGSLVELTPRRRLKDLVLPREIGDDIRDFVAEYSDLTLLRSHGLEPRHKVLLVGPPGTGKTSLAEVLASELKLPFLVVRYDGLIASYLGETATRLRKLTDFISQKPCLVFFDEFDTVGKERGDTQETGEIKRVVSSLLLQMDSIPSHCVVVCATNHPELLDRAVWRRFELRLEVPLPGRPEIAEWFRRLLKDFDGKCNVNENLFVESLLGMNFSDIEGFTLDIRRKVVLSRGKVSPEEAINSALAKLEKKKSHAGSATDSQPSDSPNPAPPETSKKNKRPEKIHPATGTLI